MYPENTLPYPAQILVSVSKRKMKRAHDRNRLKRQIREAYRLQKEEIWYPYLQASKQNCVIAVVFTGNEHFTTEHITKKLVAAFRKLIEDDKKIISGIGFDADKGI